MEVEIPIIFEGIKGWEKVSPESRAIFLKHSGSLLSLGAALRERDLKRKNMREKSLTPSPSS